MTNTDYITINEKGVFVAGKPTTTYRGHEIFDSEALPGYFLTTKNRIRQEQNLELKEFHVLTSKSRKDEIVPSTETGSYYWYRAQLVDGTCSDWVFGGYCEGATAAARFAARNCAACKWGKYEFKPEEAIYILGVEKEISDDKKDGTDIDMRKNVVKQIKLGRFLITIQRRQK